MLATEHSNIPSVLNTLVMHMLKNSRCYVVAKNYTIYAFDALSRIHSEIIWNSNQSIDTSCLHNSN